MAAVERMAFVRQKKNYSDYDMTVMDGLIGYGSGGLGALTVFLIFFGNGIVAAASAIIGGFFSLFIWKRHHVKKQKEKLLLQFKDFLEALSGSYSAGKNTLAALQDSLVDLERMYGENEDMVQELREILSAYQNGQAIEGSLYDLAERSGLEDIRSFADVFDTCNCKGADMRRIINDTRMIIIEKIEMEQSIRTLLNPGKSELYLMMILPLAMILMMNGVGLIPDGTEKINLIVKSIGLAVFGIAFLIGWKLTNIKI